MVLVHLLFLTELSDQLIDLAEGEPFAFLRFHPVVRFDDHFEEFDGTVEQLHFGVSELLKLLLFELTKADLEELLLIKAMCKLHEDKNVIVLGFGNHVLTEYLDE